MYFVGILMWPTEVHWSDTRGCISAPGPHETLAVETVGEQWAGLDEAYS